MFINLLSDQIALPSTLRAQPPYRQKVAADHAQADHDPRRQRCKRPSDRHMGETEQRPAKTQDQAKRWV